MYDGYHFWGMHLIWWFVWIAFLSILFGVFEPVRRKKTLQGTPLVMLQRRFASGELTKEQYFEYKALLDKDASR
jgi:putative membrane protein